MHRLSAPSLLLALSLLGGCAQSFDLVIEHGSVLDGSGEPSREADIGILDGKIAAIGDLSTSGADRRIVASGLIVAPGFIDMHNHSDLTILDEPNAERMIRQGVTTMILGEGGSQGPLPPGEREWETLGGYFDHVESQGLTPNIGSYVGQTQVWTFVKGDELTVASPKEIGAMKNEVRKAMIQGALGFSTSLLMPPSSLVTTEQLAELASIASAYGGYLFEPHPR